MDNLTSPADTSSRGTWWSVVINNPTEDDRSRLSTPPEWIKAVYGQDEIGEENGTLHIQAAVQCVSQQRFHRLKEWLPRANLGIAKNAAALQNYVKKSKTSVPGTQISIQNEVSTTYVSPSDFPSWLASEFKSRYGDRPLTGTARYQAAWTVRHIVAEGKYKILHLWAQASLRKVVVEFWDTLLSGECSDYPEWLRENLTREDEEHP